VKVEELVGELEHTTDDTTVEIAAEALAEGDASAEQVRALLGHRQAAVRRAACLALGRRRDLDGREALEKRLEDGNGIVRAAAARALGFVADPRSERPLLSALEDRSAPARTAAAEALGAVPTSGAVAGLERLLAREKGAATRRAAVAALGRLGGHAAIQPDVVRALAVHASREADPEIADAAVDALVDVAGPAGHDELLEPFRAVPGPGRTHLADALAERPLGPSLARIAAELRGLPPDDDVLSRFGSDLTQRVREGQGGRAYGRERELTAILERLARPGARAIVLVGPSGVGKTAIVHELARRLAAEEVLVPLQLHEVTTGEVLSGTRFLGEWQTRLKELQDAIKAPQRAIWYVPDLNRLVDAGTTVHSDDSFASMIAPALERGEVVVLGESTPEAFRRGLDRFPAFSKLFWKLQVDEPTPAATREILRGVAADLAAEHRERGLELVVPPASIERALELATDYFASMARPGNAVHLLREAVAAAVRADGGPTGRGPVEVGPRDVLATLSRLTGVPLRLLDDGVPLDLEEVRRFFADRVLGQDEAVEAVVDLISLIKTGLTDPTRPLSVFFFVGPTGVGKTEMAKALAEFIFGSPDRLVRIDLGEFKEPDAHRRLVGDTMAIEPAARSGLLTAPVRERPFSVVLLDEVEKAHRNVFDLLLPLMAEGRLVDEQGRVTDFRRTVVIMTSNLGSDLREGDRLGFWTGEAGAGAKVQRVMEEAFRPEFVGRISKTIVFSSLSMEVMRRLARREVRRVLARRGIVRRDVVVETDDSIIGLLLKEGFSERYGARQLKRRVEELLLKPLARALLSLRTDAGQAVIRLGVEDERLASEVVYERTEDPEDESAIQPRPTARIRDPRHGRLVSFADLEERVLALGVRLEEIQDYLEGLDLRERKSGLVEETLAPDFWSDPGRAAATTAEIRHLEDTLRMPDRLGQRLRSLERLLDDARGATGESRALHELLARIDDVAHDVEFSDYLARCPSPVDRGDCYLHLRRVGDAEFPRDAIAAMAEMYRSYARRKQLDVAVVFEAPSRGGALREVALRVEGTCAHGLLRGEAGLHQWVSRAERRGPKQVTFVRVGVLPPAEEALRPGELTIERRHLREEDGAVLLKRHRLHLVATHNQSLLAIDGNTDDPEAEPAALAFLAARVRAPREARNPGVVRRYVLQKPEPVARDFGADLKEHLDRVLEGRLDAFVLPRVLGYEP